MRDIYQKEKESNAISYVSENFYEEVKEYLLSLKEQAMEEEGLKMREYQNSKRMADEIMRIRLEKIAIASVREIELEGLSKEEKELHKAFLEMAKKIKNSLSKKANIKKVKVMKDIKAYRGLDRQIYGPFSQGEVVELPAKEAEWLEERGYVEVL